MTTIDKPMVPKIPEPPLGVSRKILGDPSGGDGGGGEESMLGAWTEERRGETRRTTERGQLRAWKGEQRGVSRRSIVRQLGAWKEERRGSRRSLGRKMRERGTEGRTGHARNAAEEQQIWRRNTRDGTWRRSGGEPHPGPLSPAQGGLWRPWVAEEEAEESLQTIVSIADPSNYNHPVYYASTDIRTRSQLQKGK